MLFQIDSDNEDLYSNKNDIPAIIAPTSLSRNHILIKNMECNLKNRNTHAAQPQLQNLSLLSTSANDNFTTRTIPMKLKPYSSSVELETCLKTVIDQNKNELFINKLNVMDKQMKNEVEMKLRRDLLKRKLSQQDVELQALKEALVKKKQNDIETKNKIIANIKKEQEDADKLVEVKKQQLENLIKQSIEDKKKQAELIKSEKLKEKEEADKSKVEQSKQKEVIKSSNPLNNNNLSQNNNDNNSQQNEKKHVNKNVPKDGRSTNFKNYNLNAEFGMLFDTKSYFEFQNSVKDAIIPLSIKKIVKEIINQEFVEESILKTWLTSQLTNDIKTKINNNFGEFMIHFIRDILKIEAVQLNNNIQFQGVIKKIYNLHLNIKDLPNMKTKNINLIQLLMIICQWFVKINASIRQGNNDEYRVKKDASFDMITKLTKIQFGLVSSAFSKFEISQIFATIIELQNDLDKIEQNSYINSRLIILSECIKKQNRSLIIAQGAHYIQSLQMILEKIEQQKEEYDLTYFQSIKNEINAINSKFE